MAGNSQAPTGVVGSPKLQKNSSWQSQKSFTAPFQHSAQGEEIKHMFRLPRITGLLDWKQFTVLKKHHQDKGSHKTTARKGATRQSIWPQMCQTLLSASKARTWDLLLSVCLLKCVQLDPTPHTVMCTGSVCETCNRKACVYIAKHSPEHWVICFKSWMHCRRQSSKLRALGQKEQQSYLKPSALCKRLDRVNHSLTHTQNKGARRERQDSR